MQLQYDEDFVEGAVFLRANSRSQGPPPFQVRRFHTERERLYRVLDPDERNTAFFRLHLDWFREWGLERALIAVVDEFPLLRTALGALVFRKARSKQEEGAELYVSSEKGRAAVTALRVERFEDMEELKRFLRHEFMHVRDMVNPAFGYSPQLHLAGQNAAQQRLTRERYRLLWDITIDGRLTSGRPATVGTRSTASPSFEQSGTRWNASLPLSVYDRHRADFDRAFGFWPDAKRADVFHGLWRNPSPHHGDLLAIASDPRGVKSVQEPLPGAPCPLCGFGTFDWADAGALSGHCAAAIQAEFPEWTPEQGACGRCAAIYRRQPQAVAVL